jgi:hypothetical protein
MMFIDIWILDDDGYSFLVTDFWILLYRFLERNNWNTFKYQNNEQ